jgi:SnoaL-like domain
MNILKHRKSRTARSADTSRRSFIGELGAGASAALTSTVIVGAGMAKAEAASTTDNPALRAALLEEEKALNKFHQDFEQAMDKGLLEEVIGMFSDDAEVVFNGGVFKGRSHGVSRLYRGRFPAGKTGRRMEPAPGFELTADQQRDNVEVSPDLRSAKAVFPYSIQVGMPFETETSLAAMARLHGEGVRTWWEGGVYRVNYRKDVAGHWKIRRLEYDTLSRADYRSGKSYAQPISVSRFATRFPADQQGPDDLV